MKMENDVLIEIHGIIGYIKHYTTSSNKLQTKGTSHTRLSRNSHEYQAK